MYKPLMGIFTDNAKIITMSLAIFAVDIITRMPAGLSLASKKIKTRELAKAALQNKNNAMSCTENS